MASVKQVNDSNNQITDEDDDEWYAQCICAKRDKNGVLIHCCPDDLGEQRDKEEKEYLDQMKEMYGSDMWMWFVEDTENDCYLADMHRQWLYKKGIPHDFDIYDDEQREHYYRKDEDGNQEEKEEEEEERENAYVYEMHQKYGGQWCWTVENTEDDSSIAEKHRRWVDEKCQKGAYET